MVAARKQHEKKLAKSKFSKSKNWKTYFLLIFFNMEFGGETTHQKKNKKKVFKRAVKSYDFFSPCLAAQDCFVIASQVTFNGFFFIPDFEEEAAVGGGNGLRLHIYKSTSKDLLTHYSVTMCFRLM